ncbi:MAG: hypothetical protein AAFX87_20845 [Bacteroidota bacterium]
MKVQKAHYIITCILSIVGLTSCNDHNQEINDQNTGWQLLYANDGTGNPLEGSKEALMKAVRNGCPIRGSWSVSWDRDTIQGHIEHVADAHFLSVYEHEVFAQLSPIMRQRPVVEQPIINLDTLNNQQWYAIFSTSGEIRSLMTGVARHGKRRRPIYWFVNTNDCNHQLYQVNTLNPETTSSQ